jgi:hypothetical protein
MTDMAQCDADLITQNIVAVKITGSPISPTGTMQPFHDSKPLHGELNISNLVIKYFVFCNTA